jgi:hypothetical protein
MKQSLLAAIAAWILFALAFTYYPGTSLAFALQLLASASTILWLVHVATYSGRALGKSHSIEGQDAGAGVANAGQNKLERRGAIRILLQAAAVGAIASLPLVLRPSTAFAFCGQCSKSSECGTCRCVNTAAGALLGRTHAWPPLARDSATGLAIRPCIATFGNGIIDGEIDTQVTLSTRR